MGFISLCQKGWRPLIGIICALAVLYIAVIQWVLAIHWAGMKFVDIGTLGLVTWCLTWLSGMRTREKIKTGNTQDVDAGAVPVAITGGSVVATVTTTVAPEAPKA